MKVKRKLFVVIASVFVVLIGLGLAYALKNNLLDSDTTNDDSTTQSQDINKVVLQQALTSIESGELTGEELANAYTAAGTSYQQAGEPAKAVEQLEQAIVTYKTMSTYLKLVISYLDSNNLGGAEQTYSEMASYFGTEAGKAEQYSEAFVSNAAYYVENYKQGGGATDDDAAF